MRCIVSSRSWQPSSRRCRFPKLQTLAILHTPPIHWWERGGPAFPDTITTLQLGVLEIDFSCSELETLSKCFPGVEALQIVAAAHVERPRQRRYTTFEPFFPNVVELHLGIPRNYLPGPLGLANRVLYLTQFLNPGMVFPSLRHLAVEKNVEQVTVFLRKHAKDLQILTFSTNHTDLFDITAFDGIVSKPVAFVVSLDHTTPRKPYLPASVQEVIVKKPQLPPWRHPRSFYIGLRTLIYQLLQCRRSGWLVLSVEKQLWCDSEYKTTLQKNLRDHCIVPRDFDFGKIGFGAC